MTILGLDPGYDRIGWSIGTCHTPQVRSTACGYIQTNKRHAIFDRYLDMLGQLEQIISQFQPREAAIESLYFSRNTKTAMRVSEARGVIISALLQHKVPIFEYNPMTIKKTVAGTGRATKDGVAKMVKIQLGVSQDLMDDALDAAACMLTHGILRDKQFLM